MMHGLGFWFLDGLDWMNVVQVLMRMRWVLVSWGEEAGGSGGGRKARPRRTGRSQY